ncbi:hypothetical protein U9M48_029815 [Paspalum notatum var. saurae]|uniref:Uncharacterized protein n=1 Tax=Paspalum notatum var. saurae TaxID=547442 RepID=A0AAQ3TZD7_PASNO
MTKINSNIASVVLACNSALAVYNSWGNAGAITFVLAADAVLLRKGGGKGQREDDEGGGVDAQSLTTLLTAMFASRMSPLMPTGVDAVVWIMAVAVAGGGFWALFLN